MSVRRFVSVAELAALYTVRPETVREWVRQERIPFLRVSRRILRFDIDAVRQAVESRSPTTGRTTP